MFRKIITITLVFFFLSAVSLAAFNDDANAPSRNTRERRLESWYHMLTIGYVPSVSYTLGDKSAPDDFFGTSIAWEIIRFYFPLSDKLLLGPSINLMFNTAGTTGNYSAFSGLYTLGCLFYTDYIGKGLYFRGDLGVSAIKFSGTGSPEYSSSFGFIVGLGFALPISEETSFVFEAGYRYLDLKGKNGFKDASLGSLYLSLGWLW